MVMFWSFLQYFFFSKVLKSNFTGVLWKVLKGCFRLLFFLRVLQNRLVFDLSLGSVLRRYRRRFSERLSVFCHVLFKIKFGLLPFGWFSLLKMTKIPFFLNRETD